MNACDVHEKSSASQPSHLGILDESIKVELGVQVDTAYLAKALMALIILAFCLSLRLGWNTAFMGSQKPFSLKVL